jgi:5-methylcytosine-specific restriction endonuclease McrA
MGEGIRGNAVGRGRARTPYIVSTKLCDKCKAEYLLKVRERNQSAKTRELNSERMKTKNPMFFAEVRAKVASTNTGIVQDASDYSEPHIHRVRQTKEEVAERMRTSNPMFDKSLLARRIKTHSDRVNSGRIIYKHGPEHHLWKGNLYFNDLCRNQLYSTWVKPIMERDNFTCTRCGATRELQVHHTTPLRELIAAIGAKRGITSFHGIDQTLQYMYATEVAKLHTLDMGITVCAPCHSIIDNKYRYKTQT